MTEILSAGNERVKNWAKLQHKKYRDQSGQFLVEGEHLIEEAIRAKAVEQLLILKGRDNPFDQEAIVCSAEVMKKLSVSVSGSWLIAVCRLNEKAAERPERIVILDGVQDPGNVGTIVRTAYSFGFDAIILSPDCADMTNEKCIRSTQGAMFHLPWSREQLTAVLPKLTAEGFTIIGTALEKAEPLAGIEIPQKTALVFGNEGQGIRPETLALCDQRAFIEMNRFESLNVAVAAGICLYRFRREL